MVLMKVVSRDTLKAVSMVVVMVYETVAWKVSEKVYQWEIG